MGVLTIKLLVALVPVAVLSYVGAFLGVIKVHVRRPSKVLLSVSVIALRPLVLLVDVGTEAGLITVDHKLLCFHLAFVRIKILGELFLSHQGTNCRAFLCIEGQRINLLLLFI